MSDNNTGSIGRNDTWRDILDQCMTAHGEDTSLIIGSTINNGQWQAIPKNTPDPKQNAFLVWTHRRIYFPAYADGWHIVRSVPRDPCNERVYLEGLSFKYASDTQDDKQTKMWSAIHRVLAVITFDDHELEQISLLRQVREEFGDQAQHFVSIMRKGRFVCILDRLNYLVRRCVEDSRFKNVGSTVHPTEMEIADRVAEIFFYMGDVVGDVPTRVHGVWVIALALGYKNEDILSPALLGVPAS